MAKISRKTQKVFAGSASNNGQFGSAQAGTKITSSDLDTLQALAAFDSGWVNAVLSGENLPTLEEMQALHYITTSQIAYTLQEGIPEYDSGTEYHQNSIVKKTGTYELYGSLTDTNTGNVLPSQTDNANWKYLGSLDVLKDAAPLEITNGLYIRGNGTGFDEISASTLTADLDDATTSLKGIVELATDAEFLTGASSDKAVVPSNFTQHSKVSNGYQRLGGGLIIQWGTVASTGAQTTDTFPIAFPNACLVVTNTFLQNNTTAYDIRHVRSFNNSSVEFQTFSATGSVMWVAIGH